MTSHVTDAPRSRATRDSMFMRISSIFLPDDGVTRRRLYIRFALALYAISWALVFVRASVKQTSIDFVVSDAMGYYAYLPSIVIDGDLQFENQLQDQFHGDVPPDIREAQRRETWPVGPSKNRFPIGVAISLLPAFVAAHGLSHALYALTGLGAFHPDGYSFLYLAFTVAMAQAIGVAGLIVSDRLLVERFHIPGRCVAAAVLTFWLGTNYIWFFVREPLLAHLIGASWIALSIFLIHRIERQTQCQHDLIWWQLPSLALAMSMALTCRFTNVFLFPMFVYVLVILMRRDLFLQALKQLPLIATALLPLIVQVVVMHLMSGAVMQGSAQEFGYSERERFYWTRPALILSLISSRRGLFFWTPALMLSAWGLIWHFLRRRGWHDPFLICFILSGMLLWYLNASWYAWWLGNSAGNRGFIELGVLFILGFGFAYAWMQRAAASMRRAALAFLVVAFVVNYAVVGLKLAGRLTGHAPLIPWEQRVLTGPWKRF